MRGAARESRPYRDRELTYLRSVRRAGGSGGTKSAGLRCLAICHRVRPRARLDQGESNHRTMSTREKLVEARLGMLALPEVLPNISLARP